MVTDQAARTPLQILVIDDVRDSADTLSFLLQGRDCFTTASYSATEGFEAAVRIKPDVIVLDLCMPNSNGIETCRRIRMQPWATETIIVGITGSWIAQEAAQRTGGFDGVILKPGEVEPLRKLIVALQSRRRPTHEAAIGTVEPQAVPQSG